MKITLNGETLVNCQNLSLCTEGSELYCDLTENNCSVLQEGPDYKGITECPIAWDKDGSTMEEEAEKAYLLSR